MTTKHPGRDERDETDVDLEAINAMPLYAMYSVFATASPLPSDTATLAAWMTWASTPRACSHRASQKPSRPAS